MKVRQFGISAGIFRLLACIMVLSVCFALSACSFSSDSSDGFPIIRSVGPYESRKKALREFQKLTQSCMSSETSLGTAAEYAMSDDCSLLITAWDSSAVGWKSSAFLKKSRSYLPMVVYCADNEWYAELLGENTTYIMEEDYLPQAYPMYVMLEDSYVKKLGDGVLICLGSKLAKQIGQETEAPRDTRGTVATLLSAEAIGATADYDGWIIMSKIEDRTVQIRTAPCTREFAYVFFIENLDASYQIQWGDWTLTGEEILDKVSQGTQP